MTSRSDMGIEEGTLLARGALSTLNREHRYWMEELRKVCTEIQVQNLKLLNGGSDTSLQPLVTKQDAILARLAEIAPQRADLKARAWGEK